MFCKTYSVLAVICITCLIIFSKFDSEKRIVLFRYQYLYSSKNASTSVFIDTALPSQPLHVVKSESESSRSRKNQKVVTTLHSGFNTRMDNNNMEISDKESPEILAKDQSQPEDQVDEKFSGQFNIKLLNEHLKKCIRESDHEVDMDEYISTFQQLYKFFCMLGTLFGFIGSDVKHKVEILQNYRDGENKTHYETVEKMIEYEKSTDYIHSNKETSGSRTFLRLHRSLIFVSKFLAKVDEIGDQDGISKICKEAYAQTLAKFHPWLIQKGASIAMLGLPTKKDLIAKVCANGIVENDEVVPIMHNVIQLTSNIYDQCEQVYTTNDLHGLP